MADRQRYSRELEDGRGRPGMAFSRANHVLESILVLGGHDDRDEVVKALPLGPRGLESGS